MYYLINTTEFVPQNKGNRNYDFETACETQDGGSEWVILDEVYLKKFFPGQVAEIRKKCEKKENVEDFDEDEE